MTLFVPTAASASVAAPPGPVPPRFVQHVRDLIETSPKTQRQIAFELGYDKPNIITMFKQGSCRVPVDKVVPLAFALKVDAAELLRLWLAEFEPQMLVTIERHLGFLLSVREREWIKVLRQRFPVGLPPWERVVQPGGAAA